MDCAKTVSSYLEKENFKNIKVDYLSGEVTFDEVAPVEIEKIEKGLYKLGYEVSKKNIDSSSTLLKKLVFSSLFTLPLFFAHFINLGIFTHNAFLQFILCIPPFYIGISHFAKTAIGSLKMKNPNMDVLITLGAVSAFVYSIYGLILYYQGNEQYHKYLFFETAATIFLFVLLGQYLEKKAIEKTTSSLKAFEKSLPEKAHRVSLQFGKEVYEKIEASALNINDIIAVKTGEKIPADGIIIEGNALINVAVLTGESIPLQLKENDMVLGGSLNENGFIKIRVQKTAAKSHLAQIIAMVKEANHKKPPIQKTGDVISKYFVITVVSISLLMFPINYFLTYNWSEAFLRSVAMLVISCPCAMGLATPVSIMVALGIGGKNGIFIKNGESIEMLAKTEKIIFDKTGTLTDGKFSLNKLQPLNGFDAEKFNDIVYSIEEKSNHPIAKSICEQLHKPKLKINVDSFEEVIGVGISGKIDGKVYRIISTNQTNVNPEYLGLDVFENDKHIGKIDLKDAIKVDAAATVDYFNKQGIETVLMSGDKIERVEHTAKELKIKHFYAEQKPNDKYALVKNWIDEKKVVCMAGDGVNDSAAMKIAHSAIAVGKFSDVTGIAAPILINDNDDTSKIQFTHQIAKETLKTIKQNLFWALSYNLIAIPLAALGFLSPMIAALSMAFSDLIVVGNAFLLHVKLNKKNTR